MKNLTAGQLNAIVKKLGGEEGALSFLRNELRVVVPNSPQFPVSKTVKIGTGLKTPDDFKRAFKSRGCRIAFTVDSVFYNENSFTGSEMEKEMDLVFITVADLGFKSGASHWQIMSQAELMGLELCPAEIGPQLRLQYRDQERGERLFIGMEPVTAPGMGQTVFSVDHDSYGLAIGGNSWQPEVKWEADSRFVFVRPRN